jgi:hypoxanthine phosphoribosyltransferase
MIRQLTWEDFEVLALSLVEQLRGPRYDLVLGIARGGLPLSVYLSHKLGTRTFGALLAQKTKFEKRDRLVVSEYILPPCQPQTILVIDDVVAYGDLFASVDALLRSYYGSHVSIIYATLFIDMAQVSQGPFHSMLETLSYAEDIDNSQIWIAFPWENTPNEVEAK